MSPMALTSPLSMPLDDDRVVVLPAEVLDAGALLESDDAAQEPCSPSAADGELACAGGPITSFGTDWSDLVSPGAQAERDEVYQSRVHQSPDAQLVAPQPAAHSWAAAPCMLAPAPMAWVALPVAMFPQPCGQPATTVDDMHASAAGLAATAREYLAAARRLQAQAEEARRAAGEAEMSLGRTGCAGSAGAAGEAGGEGAAPSSQTTVMLRNLPNDYSRQMLLDLLDEEGFAACYDFLYLPIDFKRKAGLGYAFVNLVSHEEADRFRHHFDGFARWRFASQKVCEAAWGTPLQGLAQHIERYRNSPLMHPDVPDEYKPVIFELGRRVPFPAASKRVRPPRVKFQTLRGAAPGESEGSSDAAEA